MSNKVFISFILILLFASLSDKTGFTQNCVTQPLSSQYQCQTWGTNDGVYANIYSINQTYDGFLLVGCDQGILSFDGINFISLVESSLLENGKECYSICVLQDSSVLC